VLSVINVVILGKLETKEKKLPVQAVQGKQLMLLQEKFLDDFT
jgi:hypothetical protein